MYLHPEFSIHGILALLFILLTECCESLLAKIPFYNSLRTKFRDLPLNTAKDLSSQLIVITGANTGIGKQSAIKLASLGATVILACRDHAKGEEAALEINQLLLTLDYRQYPNASHGKAMFMKLDLSDLHSVLMFAKEYKSRYNRLDVLINNAGLNSDGLLINGLQQLFQVNYLGHYLLVRSLEDVLCCNKSSSLLGEFGSAVGRVVNLSSCMHHGGQPNFKVSALRKFSRFMRWKYSYYSDSKLYMNLLTLEINRRFEGIGNASRLKRPVVAISVNPGAVSSDIWRNYPFQGLWKAVTSLVFLDVQKGCETTVCAATLECDSIAAFQRRFHPPNVLASGLSIRGDVPYLIPYDMPFPLLAFELLGRFAGPRWGAISLPQHCLQAETFQFERMKDRELMGVAFSSTEDLASQLWEFSASLCRRILIQSGEDATELSFLDNRVNL